MPTRYPPDIFDPPPMLFLAWCAVAFAAFAILMALLPGFYEHRPPHQRQAFRRVAGTSLTAMLLAACAWVLALTDHFLAFNFPFYSFRGTELRRLLHTVAPSITGAALFLAFVQAYAFWRKRTTETLCGHCGYPLNNAEHTNTTCAECGTTTTQIHPIPPGFRPTTRLSLANTIARFLLIAAAATLGWSLIYLPHIRTTPRISTHRIQCAAPDRPSADIHITITEHSSPLPVPGASFVSYIDIKASNDESEQVIRIILLREPFTEIRAVVDDTRNFNSHGRERPLMPNYKHQVGSGDGTYILYGIVEEFAWFEPISLLGSYNSLYILPWRDSRRECVRDAIQSHIDQLIDRHTAPALLPASSPSSTPTTAARFAELIAAGTTATIAVLLAVLGLRIADRRRSRPPVGR